MSLKNNKLKISSFFLFKRFYMGGPEYDIGWDPNDSNYNHNEFYWGWNVYDRRSRYDEKGVLIEYVPYIVHEIRVMYKEFMKQLKNIKNIEDKKNLINNLKDIKWVDIRLAKKKNEEFKSWQSHRLNILNKQLEKITEEDLKYIIEEDYKVQDITCTFFMDRGFKWLRWFFLLIFITCFFLIRYFVYFYFWIKILMVLICIPLIIIFYIMILINRYYYHPQHMLPFEYDRPTLCQDCKRKTNLEASGLWYIFWLIMTLVMIY